MNFNKGITKGSARVKNVITSSFANYFVEITAP